MMSNYMQFVKKYALLSTFFTLSSTHLPAEPFAIVGGTIETSLLPYVAVVTSSGNATEVLLPDQVGYNNIQSVAMNPSGLSIVGGGDFSLNGNLYAAFVSPNGVASKIALPSEAGVIRGVAINPAGQAIVTGYDLNSAAYGALVAPNGSVTPISLAPGPSQGVSVAMNAAGQAIIGGAAGNQIYAALVTPTGNVTELSLPGVVGSGAIYWVAMNSSAQAIIGGGTNLTFYAALVSPNGDVTQLSLPNYSGQGLAYSVAINDAGQAIVAGSNHGDGISLTDGYAALVSPSGIATEILLPGSPGPNIIYSASINSGGYAIVGGTANDTDVYVALVDPSGNATQVFLPGLVEESGIYAVAINDFRQAIVGGYINFNAGANVYDSYAALIAPDGSGTVINLPGLVPQSYLNSVSILLLSQIPTSGLSGNNLALANYINQYSPYQVFYFIPSIFDGTLAQALESAAPTRNAFSLFTADNNLFNLNTSFSRHSRDARAFRHRLSAHSSLATALEEGPIAADRLLVSNKSNPRWASPPTEKERPFEIWGDVLGGVAYQKAQHQSPAFQPVTGAVILAFDAKATKNTRMGVGAAYAYSHVHEKENAGHSDINQEYLFAYSLWDNNRWYLDTALWGGLFQVDNVRKIHMTGFDFTSKSHPKGWQLAPHAEVGYNLEHKKVTLEPFVMLDWISNWQNAYKEKGSGPFNMGQKHHYSSFLRSEAGLRFYEFINFTSWRLGFEEKLSYVNKKPFKVGRVNAFIVGSPGSFTVETLTTTQNLGVGEFEIIFEPKSGKYPYGSISYQGEFGSMYQSHVVALEMGWQF